MKFRLFILCIFSSLLSLALAEIKPAIHIFVALCDNESQGIVPVPQHLGHGDDPRNNLYWGAMYGVKTYLKKSPYWDFVTEKSPINETILERIILRHRTTGTYLVADAYRGSAIRSAIDNFLHSAAGHYPRTLLAGDLEMGFYGDSSLIAYIGHNGLMDFTVSPPDKLTDRNPPPAAVVLACKSDPYFKTTLLEYDCSPLLLTTGFMAPEAYTLEAALEAWLQNKGADGMEESAAHAYHKYQKCGINAARNLLKSHQKHENH